MSAPGSSLHLGIALTPQYTAWPALRETAELVDRLGYTSLWTWDHFVPIEGDATGPNFESWQVLAAWGAATTRVRIGPMVSAVTFRHPAVVAKMAATLDHITAGRAILGLGAAWHEGEHNMYGLPLDTAGIRLSKLAEAAKLIRSLLDEPRVNHQGAHYRITDALAEPKPVQPHLPLLIGGKGERKTLRITARYADYWHASGPPDLIAHKLAVLREHCATVGRDPSEITPLITIRPAPIFRDDPSAVEDWREEVARVNRMPGPPPVHPSRSPRELADFLLGYWKLGVRGFILEMPAPFDRETIARFATETRPRLLDLIG